MRDHLHPTRAPQTVAALLQFKGGARFATIRPDAAASPARVKANPWVSVDEHNDGATVRSPRLLGWLLSLIRAGTEVRLHPDRPWQIRIRGGAQSLSADLRALHVASVEIVGSARQVSLILPEPAGTVPIQISGGVSRLAITRPAGVAVRMYVHSGASRLRLDDQMLGAIGGPVRWQTPGYAGATDRYDLRIRRGASRLMVTTDLPEKTR